jgi:hypothetical protein
MWLRRDPSATPGLLVCHYLLTKSRAFTAIQPIAALLTTTMTFVF